MPIRVSKRRGFFAGVLVTMTACGGTSANPGSASPSAAATPTVFVTPSPTPTASPSPTPGVMDLHFGKLAAGTYRSVGFDLSLTFTVQDDLQGWSVGFDNPPILKLLPQSNAADALIFGLPSGFLHPGVSLFDSLRMDATLSDEQPVRIAGLAGTSVEFVAPKLPDRPNYAAPDDFPIFFGRGQDGFFEQNGYYFAKIGDHIRLTQIYRGDVLLVILVVAKSTAGYSTLLELSDELLATIEIE
jgi:hypothetical protein